MIYLGGIKSVKLETIVPITTMSYAIERIHALRLLLHYARRHKQHAYLNYPGYH